MMYDFTPLFRTAIGFDRLARLVDTAQAAPAANAYPPYNIERTGDESYRLTMAVAGFGADDIEMVVRENTLVIAGRVKASARKITYGNSALISWSTISQNCSGLVCGLSTLKIVTPRPIQWRSRRSTSALMPSGSLSKLIG